MHILGLVTILLASSAHASCGVEGDAGAVDIMTLNAWGLPPPIAPPRAARMGRMAAWLGETGVDVAGMQELWSGARGLFSVDGLHYPEQGGDSGLALVSPHPMQKVQLEPFAASRGFDGLKRKGVARTVVQVPDVGPVDVWVTHLQAGGTNRAAMVRARQVDQLLAGHAQADRPAVLLGDLNLYRALEADGRSRQRLEEAGFLDAAEDGGATEGTYVGLDERFDRILVRSATGGCAEVEGAEVMRWRRALGDDERVSDHRPVWASVRFAAD